MVSLYNKLNSALPFNLKDPVERSDTNRTHPSGFIWGKNGIEGSKSPLGIGEPKEALKWWGYERSALIFDPNSVLFVSTYMLRKTSLKYFYILIFLLKH